MVQKNVFSPTRSWIAAVCGALALGALSPRALAEGATSGAAVVHDLLSQPDALRNRLSQVSPEVGAARSRIAQAEADASTTRLIPNPIVD
ncbi:MAG TPA: hypothetical protein VFQ35_02085, partial [Polyangiaceae bacterium]|nr:hypothetical protein [Polyangiaceae bacterium]